MASFRPPVVVIGLGRFGAAVARELSRSSIDVLAVDKDAAVVQRLAGQLSRIVAADCTDMDTLREIGIPDFSRAVVGISTNRQASILTTALLSEMGIDDIWAKALNAQHATILHRVGAHHVVSPEQDMGERVAHLVSGGLLDYIEVSDNWVFARTKPPKYLVGVPLGESRLRAKHGVTVVSVRPEHEADFSHAGTDTILGYGDHIVVAGRPEDVERFGESV